MGIFNLVHQCQPVHCDKERYHGKIVSCVRQCSDVLMGWYVGGVQAWNLPPLPVLYFLGGEGECSNHKVLRKGLIFVTVPSLSWPCFGLTILTLSPTFSFLCSDLSSRSILRSLSSRSISSICLIISLSVFIKFSTKLLIKKFQFKQC